MEQFGYQTLEKMRKSSPKRFYFDASDLDEIATGINVELHRISLIDGTYIGDVLPKIDWWLGVGEALSLSAAGLTDRISRSELDQFRSRFVGLATGVLCRYSTALALNPSVAPPESDGTDAALELLSHYRRLTLHVRSFAKRLWPSHDMGWLWAEV